MSPGADRLLPNIAIQSRNAVCVFHIFVKVLLVGIVVERTGMDEHADTWCLCVTTRILNCCEVGLLGSYNVLINVCLSDSPTCV